MEENRTVFFRGDFTYTRENLKKYRLATVFLDKYTVLVCAFLLGFLLLTAFYLDDADYKFFYTLFVTSFVVFRAAAIFSNTEYNRITSQNEGIPLHQTYEFNNYHILLVATHTGNQYKFHYDQVSRIGQTKDLYIIFLRHRQCLLLEKDKLTKDFIRFMCAACPGMKPKKVLNGIFGKIIFVALVAMLCFVLVRSMVIYFQ